MTKGMTKGRVSGANLRGRQLRNGSTDIEAMAQWLGRKCRNHNPAEHLAGAAKKRDKIEVGVVDEGDRNTVLYRSGDRVFKVTVEEVTHEDLPGELLPVQY